MKNIILMLTALALLNACVSANHSVLSVNQAGDRGLNCSQLDAEIVRAQVVIDGITADKAGISGADWVDGILWFPFNIIAKNQNYTKAGDAASDRIGKLEDIKTSKGCSNNSEEIKAKSASIVDELNKLSQLKNDGSLTEAEFKAAKAKLLGN